MDDYEGLIEDEFIEENRETRMPKVDGVPITEGLSERAMGHETEQESGSLAAPRSESPNNKVSGAAGAATPSAASRAQGTEARVTAPGCTYDPRPGSKCPACGKVHVRTGRSVKINVPAGDVRTDFKK